jgi:hypothetical protein
VNVAAYVARSRAAQGLGPRVTDPIVLTRIAQLLTEPNDAGSDARSSPGGPRSVQPLKAPEGHEAAAVHGGAERSRQADPKEATHRARHPRDGSVLRWADGQVKVAGAGL